MTPEELDEMDKKLETAFNSAANDVNYYKSSIGSEAKYEAMRALARITEARIAIHNARQPEQSEAPADKQSTEQTLRRTPRREAGFGGYGDRS